MPTNFTGVVNPVAPPAIPNGYVSQDLAGQTEGMLKAAEGFGEALGEDALGRMTERLLEIPNEGGDVNPVYKEYLDKSREAMSTTDALKSAELRAELDSIQERLRQDPNMSKSQAIIEAEKVFKEYINMYPGLTRQLTTQYRAVMRLPDEMGGSGGGGSGGSGGGSDTQVANALPTGNAGLKEVMEYADKFGLNLNQARQHLQEEERVRITNRDLDLSIKSGVVRAQEVKSAVRQHLGQRYAVGLDALSNAAKAGSVNAAQQMAALNVLQTGMLAEVDTILAELGRGGKDEQGNIRPQVTWPGAVYDDLKKDINDHFARVQANIKEFDLQTVLEREVSILKNDSILNITRNFPLMGRLLAIDPQGATRMLSSDMSDKLERLTNGGLPGVQAEAESGSIPAALAIEAYRILRNPKTGKVSPTRLASMFSASLYVGQPPNTGVPQLDEDLCTVGLDCVKESIVSDEVAPKVLSGILNDPNAKPLTPSDISNPKVAAAFQKLEPEEKVRGVRRSLEVLQYKVREKLGGRDISEFVELNPTKNPRAPFKERRQLDVTGGDPNSTFLPPPTSGVIGNSVDIIKQLNSEYGKLYDALTPAERKQVSADMYERFVKKGGVYSEAATEVVPSNTIDVPPEDLGAAIERKRKERAAGTLPKDK